MKIIVYSETTSDTIRNQLGRPEYSYYFVLKEFLPVLDRLGTTEVVKNPEQEVDIIYERALAANEPCVFLSFSPPQKTLTDLRCPTIPVFAWEFDTIPTESWDGDPRNDWRTVLKKLGCAITHSNYAADAVRAAVGPDFPVFSIPAPVWDRLSQIRAVSGPKNTMRTAQIKADRNPLDSRTIDFGKLDPLTLDGPNRVENYDYAVSIVRERDTQLKQRNADCAYAESIVRERDAQLEQANAARAYAESTVAERDTQLERANASRNYAESIIKERDDQLMKRNKDCADAEALAQERDAELHALRNTVAGKLAEWLLKRKGSRHNSNTT